MACSAVEALSFAWDEGGDNLVVNGYLVSVSEFEYFGVLGTPHLLDLALVEQLSHASVKAITPMNIPQEVVPESVPSDQLVDDEK